MFPLAANRVTLTKGREQLQLPERPVTVFKAIVVSDYFSFGAQAMGNWDFSCFSTSS